MAPHEFLLRSLILKKKHFSNNKPGRKLQFQGGSASFVVTNQSLLQPSSNNLQPVTQVRRSMPFTAAISHNRRSDRRDRQRSPVVPIRFSRANHSEAPASVQLSQQCTDRGSTRTEITTRQVKLAGTRQQGSTVTSTVPSGSQPSRETWFGRFLHRGVHIVKPRREEERGQSIGAQRSDLSLTHTLGYRVKGTMMYLTCGILIDTL